MAGPLDRLQAALADRYAIEREIGSGGMAVVYHARDSKHERQVAMKVLRSELAAALGPDRFLQEIKIAASLHHPHILPLYDSGESDGFLYYVMPYVEGESLRDRMDREKQLAIDDALQIAREVADALSYAHSRGVIHRDIKPENILLESGHAVVADFGIARAIDAAGGERLTETGIAIGTPAYMSPEQAGGGKGLDGRSDLYSLGCVLYEMLAGQPPFTGPTVESLVRQHLSAEPPNVTAIRPSVPGWVAAALERSLAKIPADRFNPVAQFGEAITPRASVTGGSAAPPWKKPSRAPWRRWVAMGALAGVALIAATLVVSRVGPSAGPEHPRTAIAVLPFQNLSGGGPHAYFAGGLHDELITQLAKVASLKVIGRTSVLTYEGSSKRLSEIGDELGVGSLVEGSVQVVGDRLRVNVQLIDPTTEGHIWAERYDRTLDDAFAVQSNIAQQIVAAVGATLGGAERTAVAEAPTANAEAYRLYLQGLEYYRRPGMGRRGFEIAQDLWEQAVALDSTFALAHAALSELHGRTWWFRWDPHPERLVRQREEAQTALHLAPDLPQAHIAMGLVHYHGHRDWQAALQEFRTAVATLPSDARLWMWIGYVHRRLGNWEQVLGALDTVVALDPRNAEAAVDLGAGTLGLLHRYREAIDWCGRSLALAPDMAQADMDRAWNWLLWQGRLDSLRVALDRHRPGDDLGTALGSHSRQRALLLLLERRPDSLLALLRRTPQPVFESRDGYEPTALWAAWAHQLRGDGVAAQAAFESARLLLDSVDTVLADDWRVHAARGLALAGLGRHPEALREARRLRESRIYDEDRYDGPYLAQERAGILAGTGDADAALAEIEPLLAGPSWLSTEVLRLDPRFDSIRNDPRFQALLEKYGKQ